MINYNGEEVLDASLSSACSQSDEFAEILMVDNASRDRSIAIVRASFPSVRIILLGENRGPGAARNAGLRAAKTDLVLFTDNDVCLAPGCATRLSATLAEHPEAAIAMPRILYAADRSSIQWDGADSHFLGLMIIYGGEGWMIPESDSAEPRTIGSIVTACFAVDRRKAPGPEAFDESFFIYFEDHDFGVRTRALGHEILAVPTAICYHGAGTEGLSIRRMGNYARLRVFLVIRNRWQFILKNYRLRTLALLGPVLLLYETAQLLVVIRNGWLREWVRAAAWIAGHPRTILRKRLAMQRTRRRPDRALMRDGPIPFRRELTAGSLERAAKRFLDRVTGFYWRRVERFV